MAAGGRAATLSVLLRWQRVGVVAYTLLAAGAFVSSRLALGGTFVMWVFWAQVVARTDASRLRE